MKNGIQSKTVDIAKAKKPKSHHSNGIADINGARGDFQIYLNTLKKMCEDPSKRNTEGLSPEAILRFLQKDENLSKAINEAYIQWASLNKDYPEIAKLDEKNQCKALQEDLVNFYDPEAINPYVALAASGPWIITSFGAVIHDSGGYGMLGFGHDPQNIVSKMSDSHVMANVMTPSISHLKLTEALKREIGHTRPKGQEVFSKFLCMNSGSESVTVAIRISDIHCQAQLQGRHSGKTPKFLALDGSFHGRTDRPAQVSSSSLPTYKRCLASFSNVDNLVTIPPNDIDALKAAFNKADTDGYYFELMLMEPVMGEGNPGLSITPEFYREARELTAKNNTLLLIDSIQAGIRTNGCLSIVDYPGFQNIEPPDMETYSKALNAGQYPLSVLGMSSKVASMYVHGIYGNTMTANPRALEIGIEVLDSMTPELRKNIVNKGHEFLKKLGELETEFPEIVIRLEGTGLLFAVHLDKQKAEVLGPNGIEKQLRKKGIGVIHGGENALRFTPHFRVSSDEIDLIIDILRTNFKSFS